MHRRDAAIRRDRQALGLPGNDPAGALLLSVTNRVTGPARIAADRRGHGAKVVHESGYARIVVMDSLVCPQASAQIQAVWFQLEELIDQLDELTVDIGEPDAKVQVFCE